MIGVYNANYRSLKEELVREGYLELVREPELEWELELVRKREPEHNLEQEHSLMLNAGFIVDTINGIYILPGYGAFSQNVDIKSIEDLRKDDTYDEIVSLMENEGYEFVLGPAAPVIGAPAKCNDRGLYCKNYEEILEIQKNVSTETKYGTMTWIIKDL